jgi:hypothetical protein
MMPDLGETIFICGAARTSVPNIWLFLVSGSAGAVTFACILAMLKMLAYPGEMALDHPKRRVLAADR